MKIKFLSSLLATTALASGTLLVNVIPAAAGGKFVGNCSNIFPQHQPPKFEPKHEIKQVFHSEPKHEMKQMFHYEPKPKIQPVLRSAPIKKFSFKR
jgi:hypothetical protein